MIERKDTRNVGEEISSLIALKIHVMISPLNSEFVYLLSRICVHLSSLTRSAASVDLFIFLCRFLGLKNYLNYVAGRPFGCL